MPRRTWYFSLVIVGVACFAAGWLARGSRSPEAEFARLTPIGGRCVVRGYRVQAIPQFRDRMPPFAEPREGSETLFYDRVRDRATLWVGETPLDDEIEVAALRLELVWREPGGWMVEDCAEAIRRRF